MNERVAVLATSRSEPLPEILQRAQEYWACRTDPCEAQKLIELAEELQKFADWLMKEYDWDRKFSATFNPSNYVFRLMGVATYLDFISTCDIGFAHQLELMGKVHEVCSFALSNVQMRTDTGKRACFQFLYLLARAMLRLGARNEAEQIIAQANGLLSMYWRSPWHAWATSNLKKLA